MFKNTSSPSPCYLKGFIASITRMRGMRFLCHKKYLDDFLNFFLSKVKITAYFQSRRSFKEMATMTFIFWTVIQLVGNAINYSVLSVMWLPG